MPTLNFHPFTKEDWYGFSGASCFRDGSQPLICDSLVGCIIVIGGNEHHTHLPVFCEIIYCPDDIQDHSTMLEFLSLEEAIANLAMLFDPTRSHHLKATILEESLL